MKDFQGLNIFTEILDIRFIPKKMLCYACKHTEQYTMKFKLKLNIVNSPTLTLSIDISINKDILQKLGGFAKMFDEFLLRNQMCTSC